METVSMALPELIANAKILETQIRELQTILGRILQQELPALKLKQGPRLTKQENRILGMINEGKKIQQIAKELNLSKRTVETHAYNMRKKVRM